MKLLMKCLSVFLMLYVCTTYAHENKQIFIGTSGAKTVFLLDVLDEADLQNLVISENGEVYIKVDKIIALPKSDISNFLFYETALHSCGIKSLNEAILTYDDDKIVQCVNPRCRFVYVPKSQYGRRCPSCGTVN